MNIYEFVGGSETCVIFGAVMVVTATVFGVSVTLAVAVPDVFI